MFTLHMIQALHGDCTLIEYGSQAAPRLMLVDGGPPTVFVDHLRPVLEDFAARGMRLNHVVLTHSDDDHVVGLVDLIADARARLSRGENPLIPIDAVWVNSFAFDSTVAPSLSTIPAAVNPATNPAANPAAPLEGEGAFDYGDVISLRELLAQLDIPRNPEFGGATIMTGPSGPGSSRKASGDDQPGLALGNARLTLIGPSDKNLARMQKEWDAYVAKHRPGVPEIFAPDVPDRVSPDQTIPNRSSIMFLFEADGRSALLTGDGRASDILSGLERAGLLPKGSTLHVDVLKLPHHGSDRNNSLALFERVTADTYLISANGQDGNPDYPTLVWLVRTARAQGRTPRIIATNRTPTLERLLLECPAAEWGYTLELLPVGETKFVVGLG